jgi:DNA-binding winged helix-turn-helix (wHTH) protein
MRFIVKVVDKEKSFMVSVTKYICFSWVIILACLFAPATNLFGETIPDDAEKINLALRRMADHLLRASGDHSSRIPAIDHVDDQTWKILMHQRFEYDSLPRILQASFARYEIGHPYQVTIRRCDNHTIDLGYSHQDVQQDSIIPCSGRIEPEGCHYIEVRFLKNNKSRQTFWASTGLLLVLTLFTGSGALWWYRKNGSESNLIAEETNSLWIHFGKSKLHATGQILLCGDHREQLTYREAKLLRLFASQPNQLLERDFILREIWGDEGVQVSRSVDMFVSRLRKKLTADPSVNIVAVHGVGYRMEITMV